MEVLKGFPQGGCGWKSYFFYVRLDQASVAVECLPSFMRLWGAGVHNPIPPFPYVRRSRLIDLVSAHRLIMLWRLLLKIPPCPLSMSLGGAVVEGRLTLRKMESRS
ncbi:hypothetical protein HID58_092367 [Brassica napus]|uniref:Uncharacterized protein n=1 Tax=Brassica napus TaxID=3708 RepID=A0ABQ7WWR3_BRANA|nr:hypothetical protein HID58_092367 [Brassica napus]